jgi:putative salt-induced outer membrane protein YdiY
MVCTVPILVGLCLALAGAAAADEILFLNGDRLSGKIVQAADGKLKIKTEMAGEILVQLSKIKTFSTDDPIVIRIGDKTVITSRVATGPDGTIQAVPSPGSAPQSVALKDVTQINPSRPKWTGSVSVNGLVTTGNSETTSIGVAADAVRRAERDRITLGAGYLYGRQEIRDTGEDETTVDSMFGFGKYDYFLVKDFYLFGSVRAERDRIADLDLRFTPSVGLGYQWFEGPTLNLSSEAGVAWIYEDYRHRESASHFGARLAYHVDYKPHDVVLLFHNLEWLPSFEDPVGDYNLNTDAGVRATIVGGLFSEIKVELRQDSTPAPGRDKTDVRYLLAVGYAF